MPGLLFIVAIPSRADGQTSDPAADQDDYSSQRVLEMLRENAASLSPVTVAYTRVRVPAGDPGESLSSLNVPLENPRDYFFSSECKLMWSKGRLYLSQTRPGTGEGESSTFLQEYSLVDGVEYVGRRFASHHHLFKQRPTPTPNEAVDSTNYLAVCGHIPTWGDDQIGSLELRSGITHLLDSGGSLKGIQPEKSGAKKNLLRVDIIGPNPWRQQADSIDFEAERQKLESMNPEMADRHRRWVTLLEEQKSASPTRNYTFWLDPKSHFAISASEERMDEGLLLVERKYAEFEQIQGRNVWLPRICTVRHFSYHTLPSRVSASPLVTEEFRVSSIDSHPLEPSHFVVEYTEGGAWIDDATAPGAANEPGGYLSTVIGLERHEPIESDVVKPSTYSSWQWFVGLNVLGLIVLVGFFGWRRIKHA
ncbi:MAG: hypothetical protein KDA93_26725 [Planctomycetaceae bacterium]|nr:hypothetical protein [Planctomycetaceae bacterium]